MRDISVDDGYSPPKRIVRPGFLLTIAGLGIAVVGLGILAMPACGCSYRGKAYMAAMKSDLRNLVTAQESYFSRSQTYTTTLSTTYFAATAGVGYTIASVGASGWNATAWHTGTTRTCAIFLGDAPAVAPAVDGGQVTCT